MPNFLFIGLKKSLLNVFHDGSCHPGMALVIDDRLKVWDEKDQLRVHVVPAFTPYYAPQAEVMFMARIPIQIYHIVTNRISPFHHLGKLFYPSSVCSQKRCMQC
jgi:hypothetical protein